MVELQLTTEKVCPYWAQVREEQQFMRQVNSGEWVRDQHVVRQTWREAPWCLEDASHVRLPVIQSRLAHRLHLELAGAAPVSCLSVEFRLPCTYRIFRYLSLCAVMFQHVHIITNAQGPRTGSRTMVLLELSCR